jgi:hypothetical protein
MRKDRFSEKPSKTRSYFLLKLDSLHNTYQSRHKFNESYIIDEKTGCWLWNKYKNKVGYGQIVVDINRFISAHRFSYEQSKGSIPIDKVVCHSCDNRSCVNPAHLFLASQSENILDCVKKGRWHRTKLTPAQVIFIRNSPLKQIQLAKMFNVTKTAIYFIRNNKRQSWVTED